MAHSIAIITQVKGKHGIINRINYNIGNEKSVFLTFLIEECKEIFPVANAKMITINQFDAIDEGLLYKYLDWLSSYVSIIP